MTLVKVDLPDGWRRLRVNLLTGRGWSVERTRSARGWAVSDDRELRIFSVHLGSYELNLYR